MILLLHVDEIFADEPGLIKNDEDMHSTLTLQLPLFIAIEIQKYEDAIKISQSSWTAPNSLSRKV